MKIEIEAKDVKAVLLKAKKAPMSKKQTYTVEIETVWESWSNTHVVFKTENYQEALNTYQHLLGEMEGGRTQ